MKNISDILEKESNPSRYNKICRISFRKFSFHLIWLPVISGWLVFISEIQQFSEFSANFSREFGTIGSRYKVSGIVLLMEAPLVFSPGYL